MKSRVSIQRAALGLSVLLLSACGGGDEQGGGPPPAGVSVAEVVVRDVVEWDEFSGRIEAVESVDIRPRVSGYIDEIHFRDGAVVAQGDLLFSIDDREYRAALALARADVERARTRLELAGQEAERGRRLAEARALSAEELAQRDSELQQAKADLASAEARAEQAALNVGFTKIRAPMAGRIGAAQADPGNLVAPDTGVLATIVSLDPVHVVFEGDERIYLKYQAAARDGVRPSSRDNPNPVKVGLASDTDFPYEGTMDFVDNAIDPATGTIQGRAILPNKDGFLIPGLFARVRLLGSKVDQALLIHPAAVLTDQERKFVYVATDDNKAVRRDVELGRDIDGLLVVTNGLEPGENIVVNGVRKIFFSGAPIQPATVPMDDPTRDVSRDGDAEGESESAADGE